MRIGARTPATAGSFASSEAALDGNVACTRFSQVRSTRAAGGLDERLDGPASLPSLDHDLDAAARDRAELRAGAMR